MARSEVLVEYRAIMKKLEADLTLEVTIPADSLTTFKKQLSQAKFHMGVAGRLSYSESTDTEGNWKVCIVLHPKSSKVATILSLNGQGGL